MPANGVTFSPSTQASILYWIHHGAQGACTPSEMVTIHRRGRSINHVGRS